MAHQHVQGGSYASGRKRSWLVFRAIALVAASVLTVPVLAQNAAPDAGKTAQTTTVPANTVKTVKADKAVTKHHVARHHHGVKMVKHAGHGKYAHHMKHHNAAVKQVSGKPVTARHVSAKPAARSGVN